MALGKGGHCAESVIENDPKMTSITTMNLIRRFIVNHSMKTRALRGIDPSPVAAQPVRLESRLCQAETATTGLMVQRIFRVEYPTYSTHSLYVS